MLTKLLKIQEKLKAPKNLYNKFGDFNYRNAEGILEAAKPLLAKEGLVLTLTDEIISVDTHRYVKALATVTECESGKSITVSAMAREPEEKKGMDASQITGSCSSYARKYALNGLFLLDDTKDSDAGKTPILSKEILDVAEKEKVNLDKLATKLKKDKSELTDTDVKMAINANREYRRKQEQKKKEQEQEQKEQEAKKNEN